MDSSTYECSCGVQVLLDKQSTKNHMKHCQYFRNSFGQALEMSKMLFSDARSALEVQVIRHLLDSNADDRLQELGAPVLSAGGSIFEEPSVSQRNWKPKEKFNFKQPHAPNPIFEDDEFAFSPFEQRDQHKLSSRSINTSSLKKSLHLSQGHNSNIALPANSQQVALPKAGPKRLGDPCMVCSKQSDAESCYQSNCGHCSCLECVQNYLFAKLKLEETTRCFVEGCSYIIALSDVKAFALRWGSILESNLNNSLLSLNILKNIVTCSGCREKFFFEPGDQSDSPDKDGRGLPMKPLYRRLYAEDRFKCLSQRCSKEQCKVCGVSPYHIGYTCTEARLLKPCRYCDAPLEEEVNYLVSPFSDICTINNECLGKSVYACQTILPCGHRCFGYKDEKMHCQCLLPTCKAYVQTRTDVCTYCNETLIHAPSVKLRCGDLFHVDCIKQSLEKKWCTKRITFGFLNCPNCKEQIGLPIDCTIPRNFYLPAKDLMKLVVDQSLNKLAIEGREKDLQLTNPNSRFFNKKQDYALAVYAFYECSKCKKPFIGGQVNCEMEANVDPDPNNRETYVCINCSGGTKCQFHGTDAIIHKCKYCCQPATWFCWGTTHFCNNCHNKQIQNSNFSKAGPFGVCDKNVCIFKGAHPPNPCDANLGCSLCQHA